MWLYSEMNFIISPGVNGKFLLNYQLYYLLRRQYYLQNKVYKRKKKKKRNSGPFIVCVLSHAWLFATLWTVACQAPLAVRLLCPWDFSGRNTGVGCHFLIQGIFTTQALNLYLLCLLNCRQILSLWSHEGSLSFFKKPLPRASLVAQMVKNLPIKQETRVWSLVQKIPEKGMATHSSIFAWRIPWTEEPGWLQSMGPQRIRHN